MLWSLDLGCRDWHVIDALVDLRVVSLEDLLVASLGGHLGSLGEYMDFLGLWGETSLRLSRLLSLTSVSRHPKLKVIWLSLSLSSSLSTLSRIKEAIVGTFDSHKTQDFGLDFPPYTQ